MTRPLRGRRSLPALRYQRRSKPASARRSPISAPMSTRWIRPWMTQTHRNLSSDDPRLGAGPEVPWSIRSTRLVGGRTLFLRACVHVGQPDGFTESTRPTIIRVHMPRTPAPLEDGDSR
jgi:hypothetical protein